MIRILCVGDVVGRAGREALAARLFGLRDREQVDLVVANGENAAAGFGLTSAVAEELLSVGVDVITTGNHVWAKKEFWPYLDRSGRVVRPGNFPPGNPGRGWTLCRAGAVPVAVVNLQGRLFMDQAVDDPFRAAEAARREVGEQARVVVVDFHAEATSEKVALGRFLDGQVTAVVGTHTHVPTADARLLPGGTAYVTDLGMTGPPDSVIGIQVDIALSRFRTGRPTRMEVADGPATINGVIVDCDPDTGRALAIRPVHGA